MAIAPGRLGVWCALYVKTLPTPSSPPQKRLTLARQSERCIENGDPGAGAHVPRARRAWLPGSFVILAVCIQALAGSSLDFAATTRLNPVLGAGGAASDTAAGANGDLKDTLPPLAQDQAHVPFGRGRWAESSFYFQPNQMVVDVMVLYTSLARQSFGAVGVKNKIALAMACLNEACNRSGVNARFRLVYQGETTWYTESQMAQDELCWLRTNKTVAYLRDQHGADLVSLLVRDGQPTGGLGELPGAYSVFNGNAYLLAHEIGHNLGCDHDRAHSSCFSPQSDTCAFGYSFTLPGTSCTYGTIMSYAGSQIEQFSSPDTYFMGQPTGLPAGHVDSEGNPDSADNVSILNLSIPYASAVRAPQSAVLEIPGLADEGSQFTFQVGSPISGACTVDYTTDYATWIPLTNFVFASDSVAVADRVGTDGQRFYRAKVRGTPMVNEVGFVRKSIPVGYSMIANPLETLNNTVASLLPSVPEGTILFKWIEGQQTWACNNFGFGAWDDPNMTLHPGEGAIIKNTSGAPFTIAFVGEVNGALHNRVPLADCIRSSAIPLAGGISSALGLVPFGPGAQIFRLTPNGYLVYTWDDDTGWSPEEPRIEIGEAFWCRNRLNAFIWNQVISE